MKMARIILFLCLTCGFADAARAEGPEKGPSPYVHIVIFSLKKDAPKDEVDKTIADCQELLAKIPTVKSLRAGKPMKKETPDIAKKDYDLGLVILFDDAAGLDTYIKHPNHLKFVENHGKYFEVEKLQVFDFVNEKK